MSEITTTEVSVAGVRSPVLLAGPQDGAEAIVFVHGNPGPADDWRGLMAQAGEFARCVAPEMPGYGKADKPRSFDYTLDGYGTHLAGVLTALGIERAHLVLHDFGGPWGINWAKKHSDAFASITLINTGVFPDYTWHKFAKIWRKPVIGELFMVSATRTAFKKLLGADNPRLPESELDRLYEANAGWGTKRAILRLYRATPESRFRDGIAELHPLDRPALVLWSTKDVYLPWWLAERQREAFPSADVHLLEGLGHWPMHEDPGQVAELVIPYLQTQVGASVAAG